MTLSIKKSLLGALMLSAQVAAVANSPLERSDTSITKHLRSRRRATEFFGVEIPDGVWTSRGYGYVLYVNDGTTTVMEETAISCVPNEFLLQVLTDVEVDGDVLIVWAYRYVPYFVFDRTESFQSGCVDGITPIIGDSQYERDALELFDILDQTFVERYAFFELRGNGDWEMSTAEARATLTSDSTDEQLLEAFMSILDPLDDYHVKVENPGVFFYSPYPIDTYLKFEAEFEQQNAIDDYETYEQLQLTTLDQIVSGYMDGGLNKEGTELSWGRFNGTNVGYMKLETFWPQDDPAFADDLDAAISSLNDTDAIVFDVRYNHGGSDTAALLTASHFASEPVLVFTRHAKTVDGYAEPLEVYFRPGDPDYRYDGKVIVIISASSYSATETFILAMNELPQTTLLGRNSGGALSEVPKLLPNGWIFQVSDGWWTAADGECYEAVGIAPDVRPDADLWPLSEREAGEDSWLELALATAESEDEVPPGGGSAPKHL